MMDDILKQIKAGEVSGVQFKERILDKYDIACELVAFSNSHGGKLVVGIKDKTGETNALSYSEVQETTNLLSDIASENVVPSILIKIDTVEVEDGNLVVATVKEGLNKPYHDNKGIVWVKNGADKRKVFDNAELAEMMTSRQEPLCLAICSFLTMPYTCCHTLVWAVASLVHWTKISMSRL